MKELPVLVGDRVVGELSVSNPVAEEFLFRYALDAKKRDEVSLTMPLTAHGYDSAGGLMPVFDMHLPEGRLREALLKMFAPAVVDFSDLDLLAITGQHQLGRLRVGKPNTESPTPISVHELITHQGAEEYFDELLKRYARYSGISGMQPKVLASTENSRLTNRAQHHIIKTFSAKEYPELALNELFYLRAAKYAGIAVANACISDNRDLLIVDRFDIDSDGNYLGIEDFCVLSGRRANGRYSGSYEDIARSISAFIEPAGKRTALTEFFKQIALSVLVRNGDAHLKNFSLLYKNTESEPVLAPLYDVVCTKAYMPKDMMALSMNGTKAYPDREGLKKFAMSACMVKPVEFEQIITEVSDGVMRAAHELREFGKNANGAERAAVVIADIMGSGAESVKQK